MGGHPLLRFRGWGGEGGAMVVIVVMVMVVDRCGCLMVGKRRGEYTITTERDHIG